MTKKITAVVVLFILLMSPIDFGSVAGTIGGLPNQTVASAEEKLSSRKAVVKAIRTGLLKRQAKIKVSFTDSVRKGIKDANQLMEEAFAYDVASNAKDADYLKYSVLEWKTSLKWVQGEGGTLTITPVYKCTAKEEKALDKKIASVLKSLELEEEPDEEKVRAIHDYIINRVSYDTALEKASAYDALINRSAVCEGYAMAAYRMLVEAGLECKIIIGTADGAPHAWNIVKVEGEWYNIDLTWDDPATVDGTPMLTYDFYLKNTKDFIGHERDAEFRTKKFTKACPIAESSYVTPAIE